MTKHDLMNLWECFGLLLRVKANVKFSYAIAKNKRIIKPEVEAIQDALKPSPEFLIYDQERASLAKAHADMDSDGKPIIENQSFQITETLDEFNEKWDALKADHAEAIAARDVQLKEGEDLLKEDFSFEPFQIDLKNFPDEIEPSIMEIFMECGLIKEDE
jgi:hypothetical protein